MSRNTSRHTAKSANYLTTKSKQIKVLFVMLSSEISNQVWPSSSATKTAKPLKTITGKLVILAKAKFATRTYNGNN